MTDHVVFHVLPGSEGWEVTKEGRKSRIASCPLKVEAIDRGRREVLKYSNGLLKIHDEHFIVHEELTSVALAALVTGAGRNG